MSIYLRGGQLGSFQNGQDICLSILQARQLVATITISLIRKKYWGRALWVLEVLIRVGPLNAAQIILIY